MPRETSGSGWIRTLFNIYIPLPTGTGAVEPVTDITFGYRFIVEKAWAVAQVAYTGASASRTFRIIKGASTVAATRTLVLADGATVGQAVAFTASAQPDCIFEDTDTFTVDFASGGTAFTAGALDLVVQIRHKTQQL